jgi:hypothetical protein
MRRRRFAATETRCPYRRGRARVNAVTESKDRETVPERWNAAGPGSDMWMDAAQDPRFAAGTELEGERATLLDYLRAYRLTMEMKCAGLDPAQLARRSVPPSAMSLLGLIRHMADVERNWFRRVMAQADAPPLYWSGDLADADWAGAWSAQIAPSGCGTDVLAGDQACAGIEGDSCGPCRVFPGYRISRLDVVTPCRPTHVLAADVA